MLHQEKEKENDTGIENESEKKLISKGKILTIQLIC